MVHFKFEENHQLISSLNNKVLLLQISDVYDDIKGDLVLDMDNVKEITSSGLGFFRFLANEMRVWSDTMHRITLINIDPFIYEYLISNAERFDRLFVLQKKIGGPHG